MDEVVLAVDIGGTKLAAGVVDAAGTTRSYARTETSAPDGEALFAALAGICREAMGAGAPARIGAGCGGPMRWPDGVVSPLHIPLWHEFPLRDRLSAEFGLPCVVDNDAKAMALGEWWLGAGRGTRNMLGVVVSTGVGGGVVVDGRLLHGEHGHAGHVGHVNVWPDGPVCGCGARGCLAAVASGTGIARRAASAHEEGAPTSIPRGATAAQVAAAARVGDEIARRLFREAGEALGRGIASVEVALDLELVVLGGSIALQAWDLIGEPLEAELRRRTRIAFSRGVRVARASLGERAGLLGAAKLALEGMG